MEPSFSSGAETRLQTVLQRSCGSIRIREEDVNVTRAGGVFKPFCSQCFKGEEDGDLNKEEINFRGIKNQDFV